MLLILISDDLLMALMLQLGAIGSNLFVVVKY